MSKRKFFISLILAMGSLMVQVGGVFAAPALQASTPIRGTIQSITLETDPNTAITTVIVSVMNQDQVLQTIRIGQEAAITPLGLVTLDGDGKPVINDLALGQLVEIAASTTIPDQEENRHPVGNALEAFFSDIEGLDYNLIMEKHDQGLGFGVMAQALWLTRQIKGNSDDFLMLVQAKQTGDYSDFNEYLLEDGSAPMNWGQLRKAILRSNDKDGSNPVISNQDNNGNGNGNGTGNNQDQNKDKNDNGSGNNGNGGGNEDGEGNGKDRDKDK